MSLVCREERSTFGALSKPILLQTHICCSDAPDIHRRNDERFLHAYNSQFASIRWNGVVDPQDSTEKPSDLSRLALSACYNPSTRTQVVSAHHTPHEEVERTVGHAPGLGYGPERSPRASS
jgi:hypothetical protein